MGLDINKLREMQKGITKKAGKGDDDFFLYSNKLGEEENIRLLPAPPEMNGIYFTEQEGWWVNGKFHIVNSTGILGGSDVIEEEVNEAKAKKDKELDALISAKKDKAPLLKKETRYLIPILHLACVYNKQDELESFSVIDEKAKVLVAKPSLMNEINAIVTARPYQNKTVDGIADRVKGYNIIVGKKGKGLDTEYYAMGWTEAVEMEEKYYKEFVNTDELTRKVAKSDTYLRSVVRNYLYGEPIIEDKDEPKEDSTAANNTATATRPTRPVAPEKTTVTKPTRPQTGASKPADKTAGRNLAEDLMNGGGTDDDLNNLDD